MFAVIYDSVSIDDYLNRIDAEQRQAERLELIRNELGYDVKEQTVNGVGAWLSEAGIDSSLARKAAEEVTKKHLDELDTVDLHKESLKIALQMQKVVSSKTTQQRNKAKVIPTEPHDLRVIFAQEKKKKVTG